MSQDQSRLRSRPVGVLVLPACRAMKGAIGREPRMSEIEMAEEGDCGCDCDCKSGWRAAITAKGSACGQHVLRVRSSSRRADNTQHTTVGGRL